MVSTMTCDYNRVIDLIEAGQWDEAHRIVQNYSDKLSCLLHGYLHRDEGDLSNAAYWYHQAGEEMPVNSLTEELERLKTLVRREDDT